MNSVKLTVYGRTYLVCLQLACFCFPFFWIYRPGGFPGKGTLTIEVLAERTHAVRRHNCPKKQISRLQQSVRGEAPRCGSRR